ncbi:OLC1v1025814C1 [Oldenlandia corymbosa var. corymbosa]|uniref:OLC1v1025814C1 n=1 Tax=Oldenlandia corymbosa var. corymbosa TaxID=529605 RepID=A0AAV1C7D7_OLDCO|nr:OLC1v1025814C1 [Oldenlandia corymbosa var. corymbosa]
MGGAQNRKNAFHCKTVSRDSSAVVQSNVAIVPVFQEEPLAVQAPPIVSSYNDRIRPLLDCVDRLRNLNIMQEGIQLPTIVVVGDQSSGKSSVLESLAGISLPRGQDKSPEGLLEKVTADDVNIGLGYVCVRNRIGNESYEEARAEEVALFENHHLLSKISKNMVGIPVLAQKLVHIQASIISKCLPDIVRKISDKLAANMADLNRLPANLTNVGQAMAAFMRIMSSSKESLRKLFLRGEFEEYPDEKHMHSTARLAEMFSKYSDELQIKCQEKELRKNFLKEEIMILEETKGIGLPNFLPRTAFLSSLQMKVNGICSTPLQFVSDIWDYVESVLVPVIMKNCDSYPQLQSSIRRASHDLISKKREQSVDWVLEIIEMEKMTDYTCNPEYVTTWNNLMTKQEAFMEVMNDHTKPTVITIDGFGVVEVGELRDHAASVVQQAFDLKMRMTAYWKLVLRRLVDAMALHLLYSIQNLVNKDMETEIIDEFVGPNGGGLERMLEESPVVAEKRYRLTRSIKLLKESKDVVAKIMDRAAEAQVDGLLRPSIRMEEPEEDWVVEQYYYPCSSGEEDECKSKVSWIWNRGINLGKKVMITGVAISSAPIVLPPLVFVSALGFAASVPFGVLLASYTCTEKLMNKLLPMPVPSQSWESESFLMDESDQFGGGFGMEDEVHKQMADLREDIEMRIELVEEGEIVYEDERLKDKGYEEDVGEYLEGGDEVSFSSMEAKPEGGFVEEIDKKPLIEESKNDEKPSPEVKRVIVIAGEDKKMNDDVMKPDELVVVSRVVKIDEQPAEISTPESQSRKEETTAVVEKKKDEVENTDESGKKNKKKNKHHSKKLHKLLGKKEDKNEENVEAKKGDEPVTKSVVPNDTRSGPASPKPAGAQGSATNGQHHEQDRKTAGAELKSSGLKVTAADEKKGRTTSNPEKKGTDAAGVVHKPKQPSTVPEMVAAKSPKKMILSEEKIWDQINALRVIVGYTTSRHKSCIEELKALYIFTGVEPPSSFDKATNLEETADKLQFLMSVVGVK